MDQTKIGNRAVEHSKTPSRVSIHCTGTDGCGTLTRVYRVQPTTQIGAMKFCPVCGVRVMPYMSAEENGWEALAYAYDMSVEAIRAVYDSWNPNEYYRFSDYVQALREEARTGVRPTPPPPMPHREIPVPPRRTATLPRMKVPAR